MSTPEEIAANVFNAASIILAGRNSVQTWWTGIVGSLLFVWVFYSAQLYADVTLQVFFIVTSIVGWVQWRGSRDRPELPIQRTRPATALVLTLAGVVVTAGYGALLHRFTNAYAPFADSVVLAFSVLGQFLLMGRRIENWWCWLLVNTVAVPLYYSRELYVTAALYAVFWVNVIVSLWHWQRVLAAQAETKTA